MVLEEADAVLSPFDPALLRIFDAMPEPVWLAHPDGRIAFVNVAGLALLSLPLERVREQGWQHLLHPDERDEVLARVAHTLESGEAYDVECRLLAGDGAYRWIRSRATALRDGEQIVAFVGHIVDIDKYRAAELQARSAETRLRRLIDSDLIGFLRLSVDHAVVDCNAAFAQMLGYTSEELVGTNLIDLTPPEWHADSKRNIALCAEHGACGPFGKEYYRKDGSRVAVLIVGAREPNDDVIASYVLDLSNERKYEAAFREARDFNRTLLDAMPIMFWVADETGTVEYFNRWFYEFTGLRQEDALAGGYWDAIHPADREGAPERWSELRAEGRPADRFTRYRHRNGSYRWHRVHSRPMYDPQGNVARWFGFSIDIEEQRRAAERQHFLLQATGALSSLLEPTQLFEHLVAQCVPAMADSAQVLLLDGGSLRLEALAAESEERAVLIRRFFQIYGGGPAHAPLRQALARRESILFAQLSRQELVEFTGTDEEREILLQLQTRSSVVTPLFSGAEPVGVLVTAYGPSGRRYDEQDVQTLQILGERLAVIIENAQRYAREHRVAEALQQASLPQSLPSPPGLGLTAFYAAAPSEAKIGGDWYDAVELSDGRVVLSIGDVTGHGLDAAVTMANIRQVIRGIAHVHADPALMLEAADRALRAEHPDTYVTSFACVIDKIDAALTYVIAGHPPALLRKRDGGVTVLGRTGLPLGLRTSAEPEPVVVPLDAGDRIVLYTDGLSESEHAPKDGEEAVIAEVGRGAIFAAENPARELYERIVGTRARDDVAILIAAIGELDAATAGGVVRRWSGDARDERHVREIRASFLAEVAPDVPRRLLLDAETIFAELMGNVVRHTPGTVEVVFERRADALILHVLDDGDGFQFVPMLPLDPYSERQRGLYIASRLSAEFSVTRRPQGGSHARSVLFLRTM